MALATLRPDSTVRTGSTTKSDTTKAVHQLVGDNNSTTYVTVTDTNSGTGNDGDNFPAEAIVTFADASAVIPSGRNITDVKICAIMDVRLSDPDPIPGAGSVSAKFADNTVYQASDFDLGYGISQSKYLYKSAGGITPQQINKGTNYQGATQFTSAIVDGMRAFIGAQFGPSGGPYPVYDVWLEVTYNDLPTAPTAVAPAAGATVTKPNPDLSGTLAAIATGQTQRMEWQFATDSAFTQNVKVFTQDSTLSKVSGTFTSSPALSALNLSNGTWYVRGRGITNGWNEYGPYSAAQSFTVNTPAPAVPTAIGPAQGSTVVTMVPTLSATLAADAAGRQSKAEWQLATDSAFTVNVKTVTEADADYRASGATTEVVPSGSKLTVNGTWYLRARTRTNDGAVGAWSATQTFILALTPPPTPTALTPADGSTLTTNNPTLGITLGAAPEGRTSKGQWQLATDSGFTANVKTVTEADADLRTSGATTEVVPSGSSLTQTTWYLRARAVDQYGNASGWTTAQTIIIAHAPTTANQTPTGGTTLLYASTTPFDWTFSDPSANDSQRAYQVVIERNDTGASVLDTGKTISSTQGVSLAIPAAQNDQPLRWKIQVWDQDDVTAGYSSYKLFYVSDAPVVTITSPTANQAVGTGRPNITWTLDAATVQSTFRVQFVRLSDNVVVHDSGVKTSTALSYQPAYTVLDNNVNYRVDVTIVDNVGLSTTARQNFSTSYTAPPTVTYTVDDSMYYTEGYVLVDWSQMQPDSYFLEWHLYRKLASDDNWDLVAVYPNSNSNTYHDWLAQSGESYQYAVTQVADRSGLTFESALPGNPTTYTPISDNYWLINPEDESQNFLLYNVSEDSYSDEIEAETYVVIGRGRRTDYGTYLGKSGSINAKLRDKPTVTARQQKATLETIRKSRATYYMRDPFGNLLQVQLGTLSVSRIAGVGRSEFVDVSFAYTEVF